LEHFSASAVLDLDVGLFPAHVVWFVAAQLEGAIAATLLFW
jgi:hypothetical protein